MNPIKITALLALFMSTSLFALNLVREETRTNQAVANSLDTHRPSR